MAEVRQTKSKSLLHLLNERSVTLQVPERQPPYTFIVSTTCVDIENIYFSDSFKLFFIPIFSHIIRKFSLFEDEIHNLFYFIENF